MSWLEHIRSLVAYNEWAQRKVLNTAAELSDDELGRKVAGSYESVGKTLCHIAWAQDLWLSVLNGKPQFPLLPEANERLPFEEIRRRSELSNSALKAYCEGLTEERLVSGVKATFHPIDGKDYRFWPLWQVLSHVLNHSAHHRAEVGLMLASLGHSPGDMDYYALFLAPLRQ